MVADGGGQQQAQGISAGHGARQVLVADLDQCLFDQLAAKLPSIATIAPSSMAITSRAWFAAPNSAA
jgi:hypothetical protein